MFKIVLILVLANVVVFFWPVNTNVAPHIYSHSPELNPHFVRLNKEIEAKFYSQATSNLTSVPSAQNGAKDAELAQASPANAPLVAGSLPAGQACYRLGPFMHQANFELAQAVLFNANVNFTRSTRASQESDVFRLYLGPFSTAAEVADKRAELRQKRVLDHFSRKLDDGEYIVSLGIYSSEESAQSALRLFQDNLGDVNMQAETVVLPNSYWLHFDLNEDSSKFEQLNQMDWGENSVKLGPYTCQS